MLDMNRDPQGLSRALSSGEKYDAAICSVSIDYLTQPREMLADLSTILKKDAGVHLAFSNRCFPSKVCHEVFEDTTGVICNNRTRRSSDGGCI